MDLFNACAEFEKLAGTKPAPMEDAWYVVECDTHNKPLYDGKDWERARRMFQAAKHDVKHSNGKTAKLWANDKLIEVYPPWVEANDQMERFEKMAIDNDDSMVDQIKHRSDRIRVICGAMRFMLSDKPHTPVMAEVIKAFSEVEGLTKGIDEYAEQLADNVGFV